VRWRLRLVIAIGLGVALAASAAGATGVDARATLEPAGAAPVAGQQFRVVASIEALPPPPASSPPFDFTTTFTLAAGLQLVKVSQTYNAARCTTSGSSTTCSGRVIGGDKYAESYQLDLKAARPGPYEIKSVIRVDGQTDTNPGNNSAELSVMVGEAAVAVSSFRLSPAPPRAGRALQATLLLARAGAPTRPDRVTCRATVGGRALIGRAVRLANGARCLWTLPATAKSKRVAGSISATAGGRTLNRSFTASVR
jgi:hypothetical protein